jgi:uncharacterized protein
MSFADRYGPWAVIAGASEGTGRALARKIAGQGVSCILIARREAPLKALAEEIRAAGGAPCVTAAIDLAAPDACEKVVAAVGKREVGLFVSNAGSDPNGAMFLDRGIGTWLELVRRNVMTLMMCCHHFAAPMKARHKGGLLLVNSGAGYGGGSFMATYAGSKAFTLCFAEGLWAELRPHGIDVLTIMMSITDTPELRRLLAEKGLPVPPMAASADAVADAALAHLQKGPVYNWGAADDEKGFATNSASERRARVEAADRSSRAVFGDK